MRPWACALLLCGLAWESAYAQEPTRQAAQVPDAAEAPAASDAPEAVGKPHPTLADPKTTLLEATRLHTANARGSRGGLILDAAHPLRPHAVVLQVLAELAYANGFFQPGDNDLYNREQFSLVWSPIRNLEIGLSGALQVNRWERFIDATTTVFGEPELRVKYSVMYDARWSFGGLVSWLVPSSLGNASFAFPASTVTLKGLTSVMPVPRLELTGNLGVVLDASHKLAASPDPDKQFVYQVNQGSGLSLGVGAMREFAPSPAWAVTPFVEVGGLIKHVSSWSGNPWLATLGVKGYLTPGSLIDIMLGVQLRLSGAPGAGGDYPGLFPWTGFVAASLHFLDAPPQQVLATACADDKDCPGGQRCIDGTCHFVTEVIKQVTREVGQKSFTVAGRVLDADTQRPVEGAEVTFTGFEHTPVAVNLKTGAYTSFPLPCGEGLLNMRVTAPSYKPFQLPLARGTENQAVTIEVALRKADRPDIGRVEGSLKDSRTGLPIKHGKVVIISLGLTLPVSDMGQFSRDVPVGHHDVLVSAPGYVTQSKKVEVHDAEVVILNVDLAPARRKHHPVPR